MHSMNKKTGIPSIVIFLLSSMLILTVGLYLAGGLPDGVTAAINSLLVRFDIPISKESIDVNSYKAFPAEETRPQMPVNIRAVTYSLSDDLNVFDKTYGQLLNAFNEDFGYFKNFAIDTVFVKPDIAGVNSGIADANGNQADVLREFLRYSDQSGLFKVLLLDDGLMYENGALTFQYARYYLTNYSFQAVLLSCESLEKAHMLQQGTVYFAQNLKETFDDRYYFGVELPSDGESRYAHANTLAALSSELLDFAVVEGSSIANASLPFQTVIGWWNTLAAQYPDVRFYCKHRNDLVCSNQTDWNSASEICEQVRFLWNCENFGGSIFSDFHALKRNKESSSQKLSYLLLDGALEELSVTSLSVDQRNARVTNSGAAAPGYKTTLNGSLISTLPTFSYTAPLSVGENAFTFFSGGKTLTYRVFQNAALIYAYSPAANITMASDGTLTVAAVCVGGAQVSCSIRGQNYPMTASNVESAEEIPQDYVLYAAEISFAQWDESSELPGNIEITATRGDVSERVTGGKVRVIRSENNGWAFDKLAGLVSDDWGNAYIPLTTVVPSEDGMMYHDNGLGSALMCRILRDDTEQIGAVNEKDTYHADASCLPVGTLDYIESITCSEEGYLRYELSSGITVPGTDCEIISNAFVMPENRVMVDRVDDTAANATDIYFNIDWLCPVTVKCMPQAYSSGYESYSYNVASFTAQYVDVSFYHTGLFYNSSRLVFSDTSVFSRSELYSDGDGTMILRLYLKKTGQFYGFDLYRNERGQLILSCKKHPSGSLNGMVIMLDAGHGGLSMTGTALSDETVSEKEITLGITLKCCDMLRGMGATVILTRTSDVSMTLAERRALLSAYDPDLFVSIHCDGTDVPTDAGTHSFYFRPYSQPLADQINRSLASIYKTKIYSPKDPNYARVDKSIKYYPFYVTRLNQCPAVLVETGFLTNQVEGRLLTMENTQYWIAKGIADGIVNYFAANHS